METDCLVENAVSLRYELYAVNLVRDGFGWCDLGSTEQNSSVDSSSNEQRFG